MTPICYPWVYQKGKLEHTRSSNTRLEGIRRIPVGVANPSTLGTTGLATHALTKSDHYTAGTGPKVYP